jgi:hypothetical protein
MTAQIVFTLDASGATFDQNVTLVSGTTIVTVKSKKLAAPKKKR